MGVFSAVQHGRGSMGVSSAVQHGRGSICVFSAVPHGRGSMGVFGAQTVGLTLCYLIVKLRYMDECNTPHNRLTSDIDLHGKQPQSNGVRCDCRCTCGSAPSTSCNFLQHNVPPPGVRAASSESNHQIIYVYWHPISCGMDVCHGWLQCFRVVVFTK
jgi:hypothetical protein